MELLAPGWAVHNVRGLGVDLKDLASGGSAIVFKVPRLTKFVCVHLLQTASPSVRCSCVV